MGRSRKKGPADNEDKELEKKSVLNRDEWKIIVERTKTHIEL
jgi:hypothetical protein